MTRTVRIETKCRGKLIKNNKVIVMSVVVAAAVVIAVLKMRKWMKLTFVMKGRNKILQIINWD